MGDRGEFITHKIYTEIQQTLSWKKWKGRDHLGRCGRWWEDNTKMEGLNEIRLGTSVSECPVIDNYSTEWNFGFIKAENFLTCRKTLILNIGSSEVKVMSTGNSYGHVRGDSCSIVRISPRTTLNMETTNSSETSVITKKHAVIFQET